MVTSKASIVSPHFSSCIFKGIATKALQVLGWYQQQMQHNLTLKQLNLTRHMAKNHPAYTFKLHPMQSKGAIFKNSINLQN